MIIALDADLDNESDSGNDEQLVADLEYAEELTFEDIIEICDNKDLSENKRRLTQEFFFKKEICMVYGHKISQSQFRVA